MNSTGITERIFRFSLALVGHIKGSLGHVNVLGSIIFAGMSGSGAADCAGIGSIELEAQRKAGFDDDFNVGVTLASAHDRADHPAAASRWCSTERWPACPWARSFWGV